MAKVHVYCRTHEEWVELEELAEHVADGAVTCEIQSGTDWTYFDNAATAATWQLQYGRRVGVVRMLASDVWSVIDALVAFRDGGDPDVDELDYLTDALAANAMAAELSASAGRHAR